MISNAHIRPKKRPTKKLPPTRRSTGSEARSTGCIRRPDSGSMLAVAQWACQAALSFKVMRADDPFRDRYARGTRGDVAVAEGSQHALDLISRMFCSPGDVIVAEGPSYVGALSAFSQYQVDVCHVPLDDDGLDPDALAVL